MRETELAFYSLYSHSGWSQTWACSRDRSKTIVFIKTILPGRSSAGYPLCVYASNLNQSIKT